MINERVYVELYDACLRVAQQMGPDVKSMSWFMRNWRAPAEHVRQAEGVLPKAA